MPHFAGLHGRTNSVLPHQPAGIATRLHGRHLSHKVLRYRQHTCGTPGERDSHSPQTPQPNVNSTPFSRHRLIVSTTTYRHSLQTTRLNPKGERFANRARPLLTVSQRRIRSMRSDCQQPHTAQRTDGHQQPIFQGSRKRQRPEDQQPPHVSEPSAIPRGRCSTSDTPSPGSEHRSDDRPRPLGPPESGESGPCCERLRPAFRETPRGRHARCNCK